MSTCTQSPKIQPGEHLRKAISELPARGHTKLTREALDGASVADIASAANYRLINEIPPLVEVIVAAARSQSDGYIDSVQVGLQVMENELHDEFRRIGRLLWAIWADETGLPVRPEDRS